MATGRGEAAAAAVRWLPASPLGRRRSLGRRSFPYLLVLPIVGYEAVFLLWPIVRGLQFSFSTRGAGHGLGNYRRMLHDPAFWAVMRNTLVYTGLVIAFALLAGLGAALLMNRAFPGRTLSRALLTTPWAFPDVPTAVAFLWMLDPTFGVMNVFARLLPGVNSNPQWLNQQQLAMAMVVTITAWKGFPFYSLVILAALQSVPGELYEAARVDGATAWRRFWHVTLPHIAPTLSLLAVLASIFSLQQFTLIWLTTGGGPVNATETLAINIYQQAFRFFDFNYASALAAAGLVIAALAVFVFIWTERLVERTA